MFSGFLGPPGTTVAEAARKTAGAKLPKGWRRDSEYRVWLLSKGLNANPHTWRKFVRERKWAKNRGKLDGNMVWFFGRIDDLVFYGAEAAEWIVGPTFGD